MTIDECLKHINNFLSLPNGYRGHILFDDMHKGGKEVVNLLMKFLSSLFESEKGLIRVERINSSAKGDIEIPVRNIHPWMTLNPTQDQQKLERYSKGKDRSDLDIVVATLSSDDYPVERSFLSRWGLVLNVSKFPLDAKAPALSDSLRTNARSEFNVSSRLVLVSPKAVNQVVAQFPDSNAREFLSAATSQLLQIPGESKEKESFFIVVPGNEAMMNSTSMSRNRFGGWEASGRDNAKIEDYIRNSIVSVPVANRIQGKLHLLSLMIDSYRTSVYESFVETISQHEQYAGSRDRNLGVLAPMLQAVTSNFTARSNLQLKSIKNLDHEDFIESGTGMFDFLGKKLQQAEFYNGINSESEAESSAFIAPFRSSLEAVDMWKAYTDDRTDYFMDRTRATVIREMTAKVNEVLAAYLNIMLRVDSVYKLPTSHEWLDKLDSSEPKDELFQLGGQLADLYLEFWSGMYDPKLVENRTSASFRRPEIYDIARLFTLILDQAITQMPWGNVTKFMLKGLSLTTADIEVAQRLGVQHYLFISKNSLLRPATHELILQMTTGSQCYKQFGDDKRKENERSFRSNCANIFEPSPQEGSETREGGL
jgi:hypothetical protein